ncbi:protein MpLEA-like29 [Marchantia polymorpha subsp. ruderalis]|uniref:Uncharacterized protein n=2 Tax=Marchantia polymorpha TaxID=3197 RepID=A0A176WJ48_MARPO|nr:hypothetical protein AXG93_1793s1280 [Marchantia polymorpha subsp. ruderalis]PTQ40167.1 hypothetical protein MARPO_0041s0062 [Marchantia polymorpha]BBN09179.1 hypothetical protein Mp_4g17810 [Marchantia polymorpha subsp. ruderalis]|eukprot:PTQ40167.1 hypothetical protein MARPO_0041s0062 [Marchantia polymorpha]
MDTQSDARKVAAEKTEQAQAVGSGIAATIQDNATYAWDQTKQAAATSTQFVQDKAALAAQYGQQAWDATKQTAVSSGTTAQEKAVQAKDFAVEKVVQGKDFTVQKTEAAGKYTSDTGVAATDATTGFLSQTFQAVKGTALGVKDAVVGTGTKKPTQ